MSDTIRWVRIISTPAGEAPEWVRRAWVGIELPDLGAVASRAGYGMVTGKKVVSDEDRFLVSAKVAVETLAKKDPHAAQWFLDHRHPDPNCDFGFRRSEVIAIPPPFSPPPADDIKEILP